MNADLSVSFAQNVGQVNDPLKLQLCHSLSAEHHLTSEHSGTVMCVCIKCYI